MTYRCTNQRHHSRPCCQGHNDHNVYHSEAAGKHCIAHQAAEAADPELLCSPEEQPEYFDGSILAVIPAMVVDAIDKPLSDPLSQEFVLSTSPCVMILDTNA